MLEQQPPAAVYAPSSRRFPRALEEPTCREGVAVCRVHGDGAIRWRGQAVPLTPLVAGHLVGLTDPGDGRWQVAFGPVVLGRLEANGRFTPTR